MNTATGDLRLLAADLSGRVEQTEQQLRKAAHDAGLWITGDGRIGEIDLAQLLGYAPSTLANRRREGRAPPAYRLGSRGGSRVTYRLAEVARWIEATRE